MSQAGRNLPPMSFCPEGECQVVDNRCVKCMRRFPVGSEPFPMPEGFTDRTAWDAIHWKFSAPNATYGESSLLDQAVISWQLANQERVKAAIEAERKQK